MCCARDDEALKRFAAKMKREGRTWFWGWKHIFGDGQSYYTCYSYAPGVHTAVLPAAGYNKYDPRGIHVYRRAWCRPNSRARTVRVKCRVKDIACMAKMGDNYDSQVVLTRIRILKSDWKAAGLPMPKPKKKR